MVAELGPVAEHRRAMTLLCRLAISDNNVLVSRGPHPILDDPDEAFGRICTAFEELAG